MGAAAAAAVQASAVGGLSMTTASKLADCCHLVDCCLFCVKICTAQLAYMDPLRTDAEWACDNAYADAL